MEPQNEWVTCLIVVIGFVVCFGLTLIVNRQRKRIREIIKEREEWKTRQSQ